MLKRHEVLDESRCKYAANPSPIKATARHRSEADYAANSSKKAAARFTANPSLRKAAARRWSKAESNAVQKRAAVILNYYKRLLQKRTRSFTPQKLVLCAFCVEIDMLWQ